MTLVLAFGLPTYASDIVGGWAVIDSITITEGAQAAFDKAPIGIEEVSYEAVALLGTQGCVTN